MFRFFWKRKRSAVHLLIDENLPPALSRVLDSAGFRCYTISDRLGHGAKDPRIRRYMLWKGIAAIMTRDHDFVSSYLSSELPEKVIFVDGDMTRNKILAWMAENKHSLKNALKDHSLIEISPEGMRIIH